MSRPVHQLTRPELIEQGYVKGDTRPCVAPECRALIELWRTPKGKVMPLDAEQSPLIEMAVVPHFATCAATARFRKPKVHA